MRRISNENASDQNRGAHLVRACAVKMHMVTWTSQWLRRELLCENLPIAGGQMEHPDLTPAFNPYRLTVKTPLCVDTLFGKKDGTIPVCIHNLEPIPFMYHWFDRYHLTKSTCYTYLGKYLIHSLTWILRPFWDDSSKIAGATATAAFPVVPGISGTGTGATSGGNRRGGTCQRRTTNTQHETIRYFISYQCLSLLNHIHHVLITLLYIYIL